MFSFLFKSETVPKTIDIKIAEAIREAQDKMAELLPLLKPAPELYSTEEEERWVLEYCQKQMSHLESTQKKDADLLKAVKWFSENLQYAINRRLYLMGEKEWRSDKDKINEYARQFDYIHADGTFDPLYLERYKSALFSCDTIIALHDELRTVKTATENIERFSETFPAVSREETIKSYRAALEGITTDLNRQRPDALERLKSFNAALKRKIQPPELTPEERNRQRYESADKAFDAECFAHELVDMKNQIRGLLLKLHKNMNDDQMCSDAYFAYLEGIDESLKVDLAPKKRTLN